MFDSKVALYCTLAPQVIYFHLIRNTASAVALEAGLQCMIPSFHTQFVSHTDGVAQEIMSGV